MTQRLSKVLLTLAVLSIGLLQSMAWAADSGTQIAKRNQALTIGRVSGDSVKTVRKLEPMVEYLVKRLSHLGITESATVVARSNPEMAGMLRSGRVDIVSETAFSALQFAEVADAQPLMREWKKGVASYRSVLITRADGGVTRLEDLRGRIIAFEDAGSTSGFLYPLAALRRAGLELVEIEPGQEPPAGKVGYVFTNGEVNVAAWVARGLADAGAISNLDWDDIARTPNALKSSLRVFFEGDPILRSVLLVRGDLDPKIKAEIKSILESMHEDEEGRKVLKAYYKVKRYDAIAGPVAQDMDRLRAIYQAVKDAM